jgi:HAD superfamily hydrolase (TIGR01549 family)
MLIIFDCDGVLRSFCWKAVYASYLEIARYLERNPQDFWKDFDEFMGWVDYIEWPRNLERMGMPKGSDYTEIRRIFHEVCDPQIYTFHWVPEILEELAGRHNLAVLSASIASSIYGSLGPVVEYFSHIIASDHVANVKPDPEGIHLIMDRVGAKSSETLMIGDAWVDIMAGKNANVKTAGVSWGMTPVEDLLKFEPNYIFEDPDDLRFI